MLWESLKVFLKSKYIIEYSICYRIINIFMNNRNIIKKSTYYNFTLQRK